MSDFTTSWEEYRLLVIKELEELNLKVTDLTQKHQEMVTEVALVKHNADKIEGLLERIIEVMKDIDKVKGTIDMAADRFSEHENWHVSTTESRQLDKLKLKDRHWSLFLALIAVIAAIVTALL